MHASVNPDDLERILQSNHHHPAAVLGPHPQKVEGKNALVIRAFQPAARELHILPASPRSKPVRMTAANGSGLFEAVIETRAKNFRYRYKAIGRFDQTWEYEDPYRFPPQLTEEDIKLFLGGQLERMYTKFGAHVIEIDGVRGVNFVVWAPNATRVSVIGNFNTWDGRCHMMNVHAYCGIWELFIPGLDEGEIYKFEIKTPQGTLRVKSDPLGFRSEVRPANASVVYQLSRYTWQDEEWLEKRAQTQPYSRPMAIYEVHPGSWKRNASENNRPLSYRELAHELADYVLELGYTHVELMPVAEHPYDGSWGYQITGYYAPTSRYGHPNDFKYFVDYLHQKGIGVIIDWVPAHFPKDDFALRVFDGTELYEHADPRQGEHPDWGTLIFNYGRYEVKNFLISNALFWFDEYHIDGLRVDAVASMLYLDYSRDDGGWIPNQYGGRENLAAIAFLRDLNETIYKHFPNVLMIAEESTAWPNVSRPTYLGGLGFNLKWNMGWMNDFLSYMQEDPIHRKYHHNKLTFSLWYAFSENFVLVFSHDEVVHGKGSLLSKMPGDVWQKFANLRLAYGYMYGHPGKKLLFMGGEFGQWNEWNFQNSLDWHLLDYDPHRKLRNYVKALNSVYKENPALWEQDYQPEGFRWIDFQDTDNSVVSFLRQGKEEDDFLVFVCNFTPVPRFQYRIGVPAAGHYREVLNSDAGDFGGSNLGNLGRVRAERSPYHAFDFSVSLTVPPLAVLILKPEPEAGAA